MEYWPFYLILVVLAIDIWLIVAGRTRSDKRNVIKANPRRKGTKAGRRAKPHF